jgi:hypothetical protein
MQYDMPWCSSYPFYPLQPSPAKSTHELVMPSSTSSLNGASLAIMFHQQYDPNAYSDPGKWSISVKNELQQFNYLLGNLTQKLPVVLALGNSTHSDHAVVAWGAEPMGNGLYFIDIYDSSVVNTNGNFAGDDQLATFNTITNVFSYSSYDHFMVEIPTAISTAWFPTLVDGYGNYLSTIWLTNWLRFSPPALTNYYIVVADKMASVTCGNLKDYFTTSGDSRSFVCGIPGSCGIEEGNLQVYAIPTSMGLPSVDPGSTESNVLITRISNESGTLTGYGYLLNAQATYGELNYTVTPLNNGLLLDPSTNGLIANITFFSSTNNDHTIFYSTNIPVEGEQIANFSFTDWKSLNSTNPTTLQISKLNQPSQITTYQPTNTGPSQTISQTQPSQQGIFIPIAAVYSIVVVAAVVIIIVAIFLKRKSAKI